MTTIVSLPVAAINLMDRPGRIIDKGMHRKVKSGERVVLTELPPGLVDGLPRKDQRAIAAIIGKPVLLEVFEDDGRS
jgi:hypothetical protein